jgi:hypothetical protein
MGIVLILDQRASRATGDRVADAAEQLNAELAEDLLLPFVRTVGDEMQAIAAKPAAVGRTFRFAREDHGWWLGIGIGAVESPLGATARDSRGPAFWAARTAIDDAKNGRKSPRGLAVAGEEGRFARIAQDLDAVLNALAFILDSRTKRQELVVERARRRLTGAAIAAELGVSPQGVSQLLRAAGLEEERRMDALAERLAEEGLVLDG